MQREQLVDIELTMQSKPNTTGQYLFAPITTSTQYESLCFVLYRYLLVKLVPVLASNLAPQYTIVQYFGLLKQVLFV